MGDSRDTPMRLMITGSTSFVGRYLVPLIEKQGWEIWHLVRRKSGYSNEIICDLKNPLPADLPKCDVIVHLAAHVAFGQMMSIEQYSTNTLSTIELADYARRGDAYFIMASMAAVHGFDKTLINAATPIEPDTHYAVSKYLAEECIRRMLDNYNILRIGGIYGIDGPDHLTLNRAIREAVCNHRAPTLKGPGQALRNYISVSDVARWIACLTADARQHKASADRQILYIAGEEVLRIESYLQTIVDIFLPDETIYTVDGDESRDQIVQPSPCPFKQTKFTEYLYSLQDDFSKNCNER